MYREKLSAFKKELRQKYGSKFKGSELTDIEIDNLSELKCLANKEEMDFISSYVSNARL